MSTSTKTLIVCGVALVALVAIDLAGLSETLSPGVRDLLQSLAWMLGPALGWTGHASLTAPKESTP